MSGYADPFAQLRNGEADLLVTWLPVEEPDLTMGPVLFAEPRVLAVAVDNVLAKRSTTSLEAVSDYQHVAAERAPAHWFDHFVPELTPKGRTIERTQFVNAVDDIFVQISMGNAVCLFPVHMTRYYPRPDIVYVPVTDMKALLHNA
jgi:DNA-binding transcriptional LysR family regulator